MRRVFPLSFLDPFPPFFLLSMLPEHLPVPMVGLRVLGSFTTIGKRWGPVCLVNGKGQLGLRFTPVRFQTNDSCSLETHS